MPQTYKVDQTATFSGMIFLSAEPKLVFNSTEQDRASDGTPKWEIQLVAGFRGFGDRTVNEVIKVGVASRSNPGDGIQPYTPVELVDFEIGIVEKKAKGSDSIIGFQVWHRASGLRSTAATGHLRRLGSADSG